MKVFVTGATGFIGSHVARMLVEKGYEVRCLTRASSNTKWLKDLPIEYAEGSLSDVASLKKGVQDCSMVFHIAGLTAARSRDEFFKGNEQATRNLLQAVVESAPNVQRFLHVSSLAAVGPASSLQHPVTEQMPCKPLTTYGESKLAAELVVDEFSTKLPVTTVRPPAVYGPRDTAILTFFQTVAKGLAPLIGFDTKYVSLVHSTDLSRGIIEAAESANTISKKYFVSSEDFYTWDQIADITAQFVGKKPLKLRLPHGLVRLIAGIAGFAGKTFSDKPPVLDAEKGIDIIQPYWICSVAAAQKDFGYRQQVSLSAGIEETVAWYKAQRWI